MSTTVTPSSTQLLLSFLAPEFAKTDPTVVAGALNYAETYRPMCLPQAKQDEAVALLAAYMLTLRAAGFGDGQGDAPDPSTVKSEKEGDLQHTFFSLAEQGLTAADSGNYKARFDRLYKLCRVGALVMRTSP